MFGVKIGAARIRRTLGRGSDASRLIILRRFDGTALSNRLEVYRTGFGITSGGFGSFAPGSCRDG